MKKLNGFMVAAALMAVIAMSPARAGIYNFNYNADDLSYQVNGSFTTADTLNSVGGYDILGISGWLTGLGGGAITGLIGNPNQPNVGTCCTFNGYYLIFDNNLFPTSNPVLNVNGVVFTSGGNTWNLYGAAPGVYQLFSSSNSAGLVNEQGTMTVSVPEPASLALLGLGLAGLGLARRRKV